MVSLDFNGAKTFLMGVRKEKSISLEQLANGLECHPNSLSRMFLEPVEKWQIGRLVKLLDVLGYDYEIRVMPK